MDESYLVIDTHRTKKGDILSECKETDGKLTVQHFSGINCDNYIVKKINGKKLHYSFFKMNGIYYVTLNGEHIVDYKKFCDGLLHVWNDGTNVVINNIFFGQITLLHCDTDIIYKSLQLMKEWMKGKYSLIGTIMYYIKC
jgi:hypothetical protein